MKATKKIRQRTAKLEQDIKVLLDEFAQETDIYDMSIDYEITRITGDSQKNFILMTNVKIELTL